MNIPYWLRPLVWEMEESYKILRLVFLAYMFFGVLAMLIVAGWLLLTW